VRRPDSPSTHHDRPDLVPEFFQVSEYAVSASHSESRYVLSEHPTGSDFSNDSEHFEPEAAPFARDARAFAGRGDVLAGEPSGDDFDGQEAFQSSFCDITNIPEMEGERPELAQGVEAGRVDLTLGDRRDAGEFRSKVPNSSTGKQAKVSHRFPEK
jgi:hypothetical protein